jgi:hypothetical protein
MKYVRGILGAKVIVPNHYGIFPLGTQPAISDLDFTIQEFMNDSRLLF